MVTTDEKIEKFLKCLDKLINDLAANQKLLIHSKVNQFYYMQKIEELKLLKEQLDDELKRLKIVQENLESAYRHVFIRWSKDARWLSKYLASPEEINLIAMTDNDKALN